MAYDDTADRDHPDTKTYYVSVGAGQVLEDPHASSYELVIEATGEEVARLKEMFGELSSMDEFQAGQYGLTAFHTDNDGQLNGGYDETLDRIYRLLYECGTEETRRHIASMQLF